MKNDNLSPAQRITQHENNIASNIKAINHNNDLIAAQDANHKALLKQKATLDDKRPTFTQKIGWDSTLKEGKSANQQKIVDARQKTTDLKNETLALKEDTYAEKAKLDQAHLDDQAQRQNNIKDLEQSRDRSANRLDRLESYQQDDPKNNKDKQAEQDQKIQQERKVLAQREESLAQAKEESQQAEAAAAKRKAKVAKDVQEACPLKCKATELTVYSDNAKRAYKLPIRSGEPVRTLHVISASKAAVDKNLREPAVSMIFAEVVGTCEKGKLHTAQDASNEKKLIRETCDEYCPVITLDHNPLKIAMPGAKELPLKLQAFCPSPPEDFTSWIYFLQTVFMEKKRKPAIYNLETQGCDGSYPMAVQVEAYPKVKFELGVSIGYKPIKEVTTLPGWKETPKAVDKIADYNKGHRTVEYDNWVFAFELKGNADHVNLAAKLEHLDPETFLPKLRKALNLFIFIFNIIQLCTDRKIGSNIFLPSFNVNGEVENDKPPENTVGEIAKKSGSSPTGSIEINYPKLSFGLAYENCEAKGKATLGSATSLQLKLDPLIGVTAKVDILGALIKIGANALIPGAAEGGKAFVKYIWPILKDLLPVDTDVTEHNIQDRNYYLEGGIALVLTVGANVTAQGKWQHHNDGENLENNHVPMPNNPVNEPTTGAFSGMAGASLEMHLEGKAYVKGKAWAVTFEAGLIIAVGAAKEIGAAKLEYKLDITEKNNQMMVDGAFEWNGLALIHASYKSFAINSKDNGRKKSNEQGGSFGAPKPRPSETQQAFSSKDLKNQWVLIEPGKTPKDTDPVALYDYFNS